MFTTFTNWTRYAGVAGFVALAALTACDGGGDAGDSGDTEGDTDGVGQCDPQGPNPEQAALFNAPIEDDVEVIDKTPTHPGDPGPENLP